MKTLLVALAIHAAGLPQRAWPAQTARPIFVARQATSLPDALRAALLQWDEFTQGRPTLPNSLWIARIDLNGDRVDEFIVRSPQTYSGGPQMLVFERQRETYAEIADLQGTVYFGARTNGYLDIVAESRAGAGGVTRIQYRFERTRYQPIRVADFKQDAPDGPLQFVRERDPNQFRRKN